MRYHIFLLGFIFALLFYIQPAFAQAENSLSQLEFDKLFAKANSPGKKVEITDAVKDFLLDDSIEDSNTSEINDDREIKTKLTALLQGESQIPKERIDESLRIIPRLKGPHTDERNYSSISTKNTWVARTRGLCNVPKNKTESCNRVKAAQELLNRFTGNDDFFDMQCAGTCRKGYTSALDGIELASQEHAEIQAIAAENTCHYFLEKTPEKPWMMLSAKKITCSCVPESCLRNKN